MRIAIIGYGRMGQTVRKRALSLGHVISAVIDPVVELPEITGRSLSVFALEDADVAIDFSSCRGVLDNIIFYAHCGIPAVVGTRGWLDQMPFIRSITEDDPVSLIHSHDFRISNAGHDGESDIEHAADGALAAASWLIGRRGIFDMDDFLANTGK